MTASCHNFMMLVEDSKLKGESLIPTGMIEASGSASLHSGDIKGHLTHSHAVGITEGHCAWTFGCFSVEKNPCLPLLLQGDVSLLYCIANIPAFLSLKRYNPCFPRLFARHP